MEIGEFYEKVISIYLTSYENPQKRNVFAKLF